MVRASPTVTTVLREELRVQTLSLRAGTALLLCFPLSAAVGTLLNHLGFSCSDESSTLSARSCWNRSTLAAVSKAIAV